MDTTSLTDTAQVHVQRARASAHGHSAHTVRGGHDRALRQAVVALRAGATLHEHRSTREATLQVITGRVRLTAGTEVVDAVAGDLLTVPVEAHTLDAVEIAALLLSVALVLSAPRSVALASSAGPIYS